MKGDLSLGPVLMPSSLDSTVFLSTILGQFRGISGSAVDFPEARWCGSLGLLGCLVFVYRTLGLSFLRLQVELELQAFSCPDATETPMNVRNAEWWDFRPRDVQYLLCPPFLCPTSLPPPIFVFLRIMSKKPAFSPR